MENNNLEGYKSKLYKYLKQHPKFWRFVRHIKYEVVDVELKRHHIQSVDLKLKGLNIEDVERDLYMQKIKCEYLINKSDIMQYVEKESDIILNLSKKSYKPKSK
jgi:hypothetical protein